MLTPDQTNQIHRLHRAEHWPARKIARHLRIGRRTIAKYLGTPAPTHRDRRSKLDAFKPAITELLQLSFSLKPAFGRPRGNCGILETMHELGIAQSILDIVQQYVPEEQEHAVRSVKVRIGEMAGVVADSLEFCFSALIHDTSLQSARLIILRVPLQGQCGDCTHIFHIENAVFVCPACGGLNIHLLAGRELDIAEIEMAEDPAA
jgi:hydrogenase nickel incorporation protein HypA/HybF